MAFLEISDSHSENLLLLAPNHFQALQQMYQATIKGLVKKLLVLTVNYNQQNAQQYTSKCIPPLLNGHLSMLNPAHDLIG